MLVPQLKTMRGQGWHCRPDSPELAEDPWTSVSGDGHGSPLSFFGGGGGGERERGVGGGGGGAGGEILEI